MTPAGVRASLAILVAIAALWLYAPVRELPFIRLDDRLYVSENPDVRDGFSAAHVRWAFTSFYANNWHPLTWLSHMLDAELFGRDSEGPHVENAALHALCSALLLLALARLTGDTAPSAAAALLFAAHPQHVESVAWVAERKDLLCSLCVFLALLAWPAWARNGSRAAYAAALLAMALGLLAKPMAVSLPLLLLLLDFWPLRRTPTRKLLVEKLPFVALSLASALVTLRAQRATMQLELTLGERLGNACIALVATLGQSLVPIDLALFYPHPGHWPAGEVAAAAALIAAISALAFALRQRAPQLVVGWLWFVIALAPTLGLVQVGVQARADRYAYLPHVGLALALVWSAAALLHRLPAPRVICALATAAAALALAWVTRAQLEYWRSDVALWKRTLAVTGPNYYAETELAITFAASGKLPESFTHFSRAVQINPRWTRAQSNYGFALYFAGDPAGAAEHLARAFEVNPNPLPGLQWHLFYARALAETGRFEEALTHYQAQLAAEPDDVNALLGLAALRATAPEPPVRDGPEALRLVTRACALVDCSGPDQLDVRALATAAAGDLRSAAELAEEGLRKALEQGLDGSADRLQRHLALFRAGREVTGGPS
ncbi:MAG TPA: tetratricopeptide repeat protein [Myxococcota bacterium]|nr:tetratricopeptide repeat protein [Myxococcota bacterium]